MAEGDFDAHTISLFKSRPAQLSPKASVRCQHQALHHRIDLAVPLLAAEGSIMSDARLQMVLLGHTSEVYAVALSSDGQLVASGSLSHRMDR